MLPDSGASRRSCRDLIADDLIRDVPAAVTALVERLQTTWGDALDAVLFYGSILRGGSTQEGIVDLVAIVRDYRSAYAGRWFHGLLNRCLPPNVYYLEVARDDGVVRSKYTVVSRADLESYVAPDCLQVYYWGRLAQPCALAWARDDASRDACVGFVHRAVLTFVEQASVLVGDSTTADALWSHGLTASYGTELRPEASGVGERLVAMASERYARITEGLVRDRGGAVDDGVFVTGLDERARRAGRRRWRWRRWQGKSLNLARLIKALVTFDGGVDYAIWKLRRHSGIAIEMSPRLRRTPVLGPIVFSWRLLRARIGRLFRSSNS